jgi:hypothetical protein
MRYVECVFKEVTLIILNIHFLSKKYISFAAFDSMQDLLLHIS